MARGEKTYSWREGVSLIQWTKSMPSSSGVVFARAINISRNDNFKCFPFFLTISSGLSSKRIILSPFTKEFRGEGHSYESLNFSGATNVAVFHITLSRSRWGTISAVLKASMNSFVRCQVSWYRKLFIANLCMWMPFHQYGFACVSFLLIFVWTFYCKCHKNTAFHQFEFFYEFPKDLLQKSHWFPPTESSADLFVHLAIFGFLSWIHNIQACFSGQICLCGNEIARRQ